MLSSGPRTQVNAPEHHASGSSTEDIEVIAKGEEENASRENVIAAAPEAEDRLQRIQIQIKDFCTKHSLDKRDFPRLSKCSEHPRSPSRLHLPLL